MPLVVKEITYSNMSRGRSAQMPIICWQIAAAKITTKNNKSSSELVLEMYTENFMRIFPRLNRDLKENSVYHWALSEK